MRVLYLNPFSQQVSGPDESLVTLLAKLIPMGIEAHLVLPRPGPQVPRYEELGVRVHFAPLTIIKREMSPLEVALFGPRLARGVAAVTSIARRENVDLIHTNMEVVLDGAIASRLLRVPHVLHYRGNTLDRPRAVFDVLTRFWTATSDKVFCISNATAEIFRKRGFGANVEVLYNPVNVEAFASAERSEDVRRELGAGRGDLLVGTVGRIHSRKDIATFLRAGALAAKEIENLRLVVVGTAEAPAEVAYYEQLRALARHIRIEEQVCWAGVRRDMPRVLKALDVLVLCSRHEGFGRVVAEAMAAGTAMVVSQEGALPELVEDCQAGLLAPAKDGPRFCQQIVWLCRESAAREVMGRRGLLAADRFGAAAGAEKVCRFYQQFARNAGKGLEPGARDRRV